MTNDILSLGYHRV